METLKKNYEKILLAVALLVLLGTAVVLYRRTSKETGELNTPPRPVSKQPVESVTPTQFDSFFRQLEQPFEWTTNPHPFFNPPPVVRTPNGVAIWRPPSAEERDENRNGIPDLWERRFGIDATLPSPGEAEMDIDGDGFSNREEYAQVTEPSDKKNHPSYAQKLRLVNIVIEQFPLTFVGSSVMGGKTMYMLKKQGGQTIFLEQDGSVDGYKVDAIREKDDPRSSIIGVLLTKPGKNSIRLILKQAAQGTEPVATVNVLVGEKVSVQFNDKEITVRKLEIRQDDKFRVGGEGFSVKSIDIKNNKVIILDAAGRELEVPQTLGR